MWRWISGWQEQPNKKWQKNQPSRTVNEEDSLPCSSPNVTPIWCTIGRIFAFLGKIGHIHNKFWNYGVFNGAFHICPIFTKIFSCEIFHVFLDEIPMMVISLSNFGWVKSYGLVWCVCFNVLHWRCSERYVNLLALDPSLEHLGRCPRRLHSTRDVITDVFGW
jgi:hypothetical protein